MNDKVKIKKIANFKKQKGATLILVIIILIVLLIGSIALLRSTSTTTTASGNFSNKESAILSSDIAVKQGKDFIEGILNKDSDSSPQYYATQQPVDTNGIPTTINWTVVPKTTVNNSTVQFVVDRLCSVAPVTNASTQCYLVTNSNGSNGSGSSYRSGQQGVYNNSKSILYYRLTAKVTGNRGVTTYVQVIILF